VTADRPLSRLFAMLAGLIAWAVQFALVYGIAAVACARGLADASVLGLGIVPAAVAGVTLMALAATGLVLAQALAAARRGSREAPPTDRFLNRSTLLIGGLSLVAIAWTGLPALIVPACW
jgi:hypothetical protein